MINENDSLPTQADAPSGSEKEEEINPPGEEIPARTIDECEKECRENLEGWQRERAAFLNYKKEGDLRLAAAARDATIKFAKAILPALDSLDIAAKTYPDPLGGAETESRRQGFEVIHSQLLDTLRGAGIEIISASAGDTFDPEWHEALEEVLSESPAGMIAQMVQTGYAYQNYVIRPARVRISKGK